jgi:hypothetical protein
MASFIELPRIDFRGDDAPALFVNTADIINFQSAGSTVVVEVRDSGNEHYPARVVTTMPLQALVDALRELAERGGGVSQWLPATRDAWAAPHRARAAEAFERERATR